jgi:hypothetical protein
VNFEKKSGEEAMKCWNCGTKNPKRFKFCKECGEELKPSVAPAPQAPAQTVIIKEKRRGVPAFIWILVGMILVVFLCGLLVWLDVVDVPEVVMTRLPDPIGDLVNAIEDAREPGAPGGQVVVPGGDDQIWRPSEPDPGDDQVQEPAQQPGIQPGSSNDVCNEDINFIIGGNQFDAPVLFGRDAIGRFRSLEPFESDFYDLYITQYGETVGPIPCATRSLPDGRYEIYTEEYIQFDGGEWMSFVFKPRGQDCVVERSQISQTCDSGSFYHDNWSYNNGCCTYGCWCQSGGQWGCWQDCAPQCAD